MFSYILATNSVTEEVNACINILKKTKRDNDRIIVINYSRSNIAYRDYEGIEYHHIKESRADAINGFLPDLNNVVVFAINTVITKTFVADLHKFFNRHNLQTLRMDRKTASGKFVESDYRIGSSMTPASFKDSTIAFNTKVVSQIHDNLVDTAREAMGKRVPIKLLMNVKTLKVGKVTTKKSNTGITIIIPSSNSKIAFKLRDLLSSNDNIVEFNENPRVVMNVINRAISQTTNRCILFINPRSVLFDKNILIRIRSLFDTCNNMLFDISPDGRKSTSNAWFVTNRDTVLQLPRSIRSTEHLIDHILSKNPDLINYNDELPDLTNRDIDISKADNSISIIIPYKFHPDRWPLFMASLENLYKLTEPYDNIEIVVHEASKTRHITPEMVEKFNLVYLFSYYDSTFHKSWVMNVACKYVASGDTFVFFDADMIVDQGWVIELINCDKSKCYYGWSRIFNLSLDSTNRYLKTGEINDNGKISKPNITTSAGGLTIMPRQDFFDAGGWLEVYKDKGYGGQDNSMAYKLVALGYYTDKTLIKNAFQSAIWHLFHKHQIKKERSRIDLHATHQGYTKQQWLDYLEEHHVWGIPNDNIDITQFETYRNDGLMTSFLGTSKTKITVCIVANGTVEHLFNLLKLLASFKITMNLMVWIHKEEHQKVTVMNNLRTIGKEFSTFEIMRSHINTGIAYPQYQMVNKAVYELEAPYIVMLDDTAEIPCRESLMVGATVLRQGKYNEYGAIGVAIEDYKNHVTISDNMVEFSKSKEGINTVDMLNPSLITIRKDALLSTKINPNYKGNVMGWDLSLQLQRDGYKVGVIFEKEYNITKADGPKLKKMDTDLFYKQWGVDLGDVEVI